MKHKIRCLEKRRWAFRDKATKVTIIKYIQGKKLGSVYECPICLDFHITKRELPYKEQRELVRANQYKIFRSWFPHWQRISTKKLMSQRRAQLIPTLPSTTSQTGV